MAILKKGLRGEPVRILQRKLDIDADGIFGPGTAKALRAYQKEEGLLVDGIAGPDTFSHMGLYELVLLKRGMRGSTVKKLQQALETGADGIFGKGTEATLKKFQEANGLVVDGIAGPATLAKMELFKEVTEETVEMSYIPEDYTDPEVPEGVEGDDEAKTASIEADKEAEEAEESKSVWGTVKGWFS